jgi:hypothetical protein
MVMKTFTSNSDELAPANNPAPQGVMELEFPDWAGQQSHPHRLNFEQACRWNGEMLALFPPKQSRSAQRFETKSLIPFQF